MKLKIYINNKLYKTVRVLGDRYDPAFIWPELQADRDSGLLNGFDLSQGIKLRFEKIESTDNE